MLRNITHGPVRSLGSQRHDDVCPFFIPFRYERREHLGKWGFSAILELRWEYLDEVSSHHTSKWHRTVPCPMLKSFCCVQDCCSGCMRTCRYYGVHGASKKSVVIVLRSKNDYEFRSFL